MGQLDEADSQYRRALELEPGSAAIKAEAQVVEAVRSNLKQGRQCLEERDARHASPLLSHMQAVAACKIANCVIDLCVVSNVIF